MGIPKNSRKSKRWPRYFSQITMLNPIDLQEAGFDGFLRHIKVPMNRRDPITFRDVFMGERVVYSQGNVQPRSVNRFNVALDVLLSKMDFGLTNVKQIATGYDWVLNNFIYVATWDGTNYYLRRYNTVDYQVPMQDGYSVNIPTVTNIYGVGILYNRVVVIGTDTGGNKAWYYDFGLNYQSTETKTAPATPITSQFTTDGVNIWWLDKTNNLLRKYNGTNYTLITSYNWPTTQAPTPDRLLCYDRKSFWAFDTTNKKLVRFLLDETTGTINVVYNTLIPEDVLGVMFYKGTIYISYQNGSVLTSIPTIL